jgi:hypothetical protein
MRCPPEEWQQRYGVHGISRVWYDDLLPCRVYLRHCVLAAQGFCPEAHNSFLDATFLSGACTLARCARVSFRLPLLRSMRAQHAS